MKEFLFKTPEDYKIMSQTGVQQYIFPLDSMHNAIWDSKVISNGDLYFSLSTELSTAGYARLCRYNYDSNTVTECFKAEDVIMPSYKAIRASKFHTSISEMNDGRLVMTTHTTDKSPLHPAWMPWAYYHHPWEGYAGSNILIYDRETGKAENLGIPVPHESIYGSLYDKKHNALFFTGFMRGHTYRYSFDDRELTDFGQMAENFSFRLLFDKNGDILGASRSGYMYKINTETLEVQDLEYRIPFVTYPEYTGGDFKGLSNGGIGPDGRLYMCFFYGRHMVAYDSDTNTFEDMGDYMPGYEKHTDGETRNGVFAMEFDSEGVLWYAVFSRNCYSGVREIGMPSSLFRWDIARGGKPEWLGVIGTKERVACWTSEISINKDDIMFIIGTNHATDGPDITAVDLKQYRKDRHNFGMVVTTDPYCQRPTTERYDKIAEFLYKQDKLGEANNWKVEMELASAPTRLWRALAPDHIQESAVKALCWENETTILGVCGGEKEYLFRAVDGEITELIEKEQDPDRYRKLMEKKNRLPEIAGLPYYPGRQYQAVVSAAVTVGDKQIAGTKDGMLAICENGKIFSLGPAVYNGPIRDLSVTPDGKKVFGVGGHEDDMGILFSYDEENGLRWLGHITYDSPSPHSSIHCPIITSCAVSPDGKRLAVGSGDRLGQVIYYSL
ncbi:MAG: hypothetical protein HFI20_01250 [Lachnospiraceae bacterium]|nr:hypothetical protein [Lachnospiraceae bacterium]